MRLVDLRNLAIVTAGVAALSIAFVDHSLARAIEGSALEDNRILQGGTWLLDWITGKEIWRYLLATLLAVPGLALMAKPKHRLLGAMLVFVGLVNALASLVVALAKPVLGRVRPDEVFDNGADPGWFVGGSSFPSGHTAFYFGLCLPLAWLFPRWRALWLAIAGFIGVARIDANEHYLADVCTSIALASVLTLLFARALRSWLPSPENGVLRAAPPPREGRRAHGP